MMKRYWGLLALISIVNAVVGQNMYGELPTTVIPEFSIPLSETTNPTSVYYHKSVEAKLKQLDTTLTAEQLISYTKYKASNSNQNPSKLDNLAKKIYKLNEQKKYKDAITNAKELLLLSPNNITAHKEIALAYKKTGNENLSALHFGMMIKLINSTFKYGDGRYEHPFLINNFFEGISIYEAFFRCHPNKMVLMLDKKGRLLGAYNGYSSALDEIFIRYAELSHWKPLLKKGEYTVED